MHTTEMLSSKQLPFSYCALLLLLVSKWGWILPLKIFKIYIFIDLGGASAFLLHGYIVDL